MRIDFSRIEIHNFKSFADEVFDYSQFKGMNLVCGRNNDIPGAKNGTGKSNLFSVLTYCLFGDLQNSLKNENIRNKYIDSKEVRVVVWFKIEDAQYKVASGFNKYGAPYCSISKIEDGNELDLTKSTMAETRKFIANEVLHCDMPVFLRTVLLSSDQTYNFFMLRKWEKKEFIEKLFDISVFGQMYSSLHRDVLDYDKDMLAMQSQLMQLNKNSDEYAAQSKLHEKQRQQKLEDLRKSLSALQSQLEELKHKSVSVDKAEASKYEAAHNKVQEAIDKLGAKAKSIEAKISKAEVDLHKAQNLKDQKQKAVDKHQELLSKLCDDCAEVFKDYYSIASLEADIASLSERCKKDKDSIDESSREKAEVASKSKQLEGKLKLIDKKLQSLTLESSKTAREIDMLAQRVSWTKNDIEQTESQTNPYTVLCESNQKSIDSAAKELEKKTEDYKYLKTAEAIVSQDTLRKFIIKDLIGLLNNKIKYYLTKFGADYTVEFDSDMNYTFIMNGGSTCEYNNFSAGERQRIMLATCFAFRDFMAVRSSLTSNILILDEFIDGNVDNVAIEGVLQVLKDFTTMYNQNVFLISHRKEIDNSLFDNIVQVQRTNHISKVAVLDV